MIAHTVFFTLMDGSQEAVDRLCEECRTYLTGHEGMTFFAVGPLAEGYDRPVNDRDFHVALHTVFAEREGHDAYQTAERHLEFIDRNKATWKQVRVFDSEVKTV